MIVQPVNSEKYRKSIQSTLAFCTVEFTELNKEKVDSIEYLLIMKGGSERFAVSLGIKDHCACCPFSAPFACPITLKKNIGIDDYDQAVEAINDYAIASKWNKIKFIFPPLSYDAQGITGWMSALYRNGFVFSSVDVNHAFDLHAVYGEAYQRLIHSNARKNLKIALDFQLELLICNSDAEQEEAYQIIAENRALKGYPLRMTYQQVHDTIKIIPHEMFLVKKGCKSIAAALVYHVSSDIAQVIYWGDRPGYSQYKPINFLSYELINYYVKLGMRYLDIGPSTENSIPNYGLCNFKESIGCQRSLKYTLEKVITNSEATQHWTM